VLRRSCLTSFSACYGLGVQESETCQPLHHGSPVQSEQSIHPISCAMRPLTCMQTCGHDTDRTFDRRKRDWMRDCRACSGSEVGQRLGRRCLKIPPNPQSTAIQSNMSITRSMHTHTHAHTHRHRVHLCHCCCDCAQLCRMVGDSSMPLWRVKSVRRTCSAYLVVIDPQGAH
jgi:hypothetical protein